MRETFLIEPTIEQPVLRSSGEIAEEFRREYPALCATCEFAGAIAVKCAEKSTDVESYLDYHQLSLTHAKKVAEHCDGRPRLEYNDQGQRERIACGLKKHVLSGSVLPPKV
jgi:hypothetical protein